MTDEEHLSEGTQGASNDEGKFYQSVIFAIEEASKEQGDEEGTGRSEVRAIRTIFVAMETYMAQNEDAECVDPVISELGDKIRWAKSEIDEAIPQGAKLESVELEGRLVIDFRNTLKEIEERVNTAINNEELFPATAYQIGNKIAHKAAGGQCGACAAVCLSRASTPEVAARA